MPDSEPVTTAGPGRPAGRGQRRSRGAVDGSGSVAHAAHPYPVAGGPPPPAPRPPTAGGGRPSWARIGADVHSGPSQSHRPAPRARRPRSPASRERWRDAGHRFAARRGPRFARLHVLPWFGILLVAAVGSGVGFALAPGASTYVGPLQTEVRVRPSLTPGVEVDLPPVGKVTFDTHRAPVVVTANIASVDVDAAARLVRSPQQLLALELTAADTVRAATVRRRRPTASAAASPAPCWPRSSSTAGGGGPCRPAAALLVVVVATGAGTAATFDPAALRQPRFTGLLSRAPYVVSSTQNALDRLESYRSGLSDIVRSVSHALRRGGEPARAR